MQAQHHSVLVAVVLLYMLAITLYNPPVVKAAYSQDQEPEYLAAFSMLINASYSVPLPNDLRAACVQSAQVPSPLPQVDITTNMNAATLQSTCGTSSLCVIHFGVTVTLDGNVNVAALINRGTVIWSDQTQTQPQQWLCGGFIVSEADAVWNLTLSTRAKTAYIYIKANGAYHPGVGIRAFGGWQQGATKQGYPWVEVSGAPLRRTWSLLVETAKQGNNTIKLMHDVAAMGWSIGDRIALAPTVRQSQGDGQWFYIHSINGNHITLASNIDINQPGILSQDYLGDITTHMQAEVEMLTRNVIITGDDFTQLPCGDSQGVCNCDFPGEVCTIGMHTIVNGNNMRYGGTYRTSYTRFEKCGQRGVLGRYCVHFHVMRDCPNCLARGNAVEYGHQRGIVVHGTHFATVTENTLFEVRGAGIYIEDGNEMYNYVTYNAVLCPYSFDGPKQGCTIPGTDNGDADTANNHASYWSLSHTNHFIGNRASNSFNGLFFDPTLAPNGRGFAQENVCVVYSPLGRVEGNTCHGHGRFGTYFVASDWPRQVNTNVSLNGWTTDAMCAPFDTDGCVLFSAGAENVRQCLMQKTQK